MKLREIITEAVPERTRLFLYSCLLGRPRETGTAAGERPPQAAAPWFGGAGVFVAVREPEQGEPPPCGLRPGPWEPAPPNNFYREGIRAENDAFIRLKNAVDFFLCKLYSFDEAKLFPSDRGIDPEDLEAVLCLVFCL